MKGKMKFISMLFAAIMLSAMVAACSSGGSNSNSPGSSSSTSNNASSTGNVGEAESTDKESLKHYNLTMAIPIFSSVPADLKEVEAELNKITQAKINTTVTILPISVGAWGQQMNLIMAGGEKLDIFYTFGQMYSSSVSNGQLLPLDVLLDKYGQGIIDAVGKDNMKVAMVDGKTYGALITGPHAMQSGIAMRKDLVDKYKIDLSSIKSLEDLEPVFKIIKENEQGMVPLVSGLSSPLEYHRLYDRLGDRFGVLPNYDNGLKIENLYETQEYADQLKLIRKWYQAGYINKDAATTQSTVQEMVKADKAFSYFMAYKPGLPDGESRATGKELVMIPLTEAHSTTYDFMTGFWTIAQHSENPERAMMMLNLMYSDSDVTNLLAWGIEGKHYVKVSETQIDYPAGVNNNNVGYKFAAYLTGNQMNAYVFKTQDPDIWKQVNDFNASAIKSKAFGFAFNSNPVKNEITAISNVVDQYRKVLETGTVDPEGKLAEFNKKLKAAGIEKVIAEKQKQLDEWAAANQ
ncbi:ABC transporter substrate-binding protein [Paenibacillus sp. FSL H7-0326]|uniref:ABC transporter substrate-binding protein n=1 Tax=Paenibacillus sp. FSL H7-0326 TaxID=1921144 RepID=UPI00096D6837|nr:ABC transporter substrate-binding protein [Paenibacillus sp. FSL H7-0326]OMC71476.1 ABC transporter substrate-binding protein [Paenibacillus sp. FSL H7-0326]